LYKYGYGEKMDYNKIIIALVILLAIVAAGGLLFAFNSGSNNAPAVNNNTTNTSQSVSVEQVNSEEVASSDSSGSSGSSTHVIIGEDGCYYRVDDSGNILESLGPSKKYYPNGYGGKDPVSYPNAEPANRYIKK
jgi:hypothetical protein